MKPVAAKVGIAAGMLAVPVLFFPLFNYFLGRCFFEGGCWPHGGLKFFSVFLGACAVGALIGWIVAKLVNQIVSRRDE